MCPAGRCRLVTNGLTWNRPNNAGCRGRLPGVLSAAPCSAKKDLSIPFLDQVVLDRFAAFLTGRGVDIVSELVCIDSSQTTPVCPVSGVA